MPPKAKAQPAAPGKKAEQKKKDKIIEDKTFGLKNKKGAKQQKFIQQVQNQVKLGGNASSKKVEELKKADLTKKDEKKKEQAELNQLFKPVTTQKVEKGADPKSVLCAFFKQGQCGKGDKCKFSHDLSIERKAEKRSAYVDARDDDNMENWDEAKLKEVVEKKHAEADSKKPKTEIICRYFLDALEKNKYGWFWQCPNGDNCIYRHALPPGFMLNKDKKKDDKKDEISIEDLVERERAALDPTLSKITLEAFMAWKKRKIQEKKANAIKDEARKKAEFKAGRNVGLSGREMFTFNPEMATQDQMEDDEVAYDTRYLPEDDDDEEDDEERRNQPQNINELTLESLIAAAREADNTGTVSNAAERLTNAFSNHVPADEKIEGAVGGENVREIQGDVPIDENLFVDDDDDLDDLEDDLDEMNMTD